MRIALDCRSVFRGMGGIGRYAWNLLHEFADLDRENDYLCIFTHLGPPEPLRLPSRFRVRIFEAGMIDERFDQFALPGILEEEEIGLYHNPTFSVPVVRTRSRTVATIHDVVFKRHPELVEPKLRLYLDAATRRACRAADALVTVSEFSREEISRLYDVDPSRITVIPNGIRPPGPATAESPVRGSYVLYVGSIEEKKNIDILLRGFRGVKSSVRLVLAGSKGGYPLEERIAELGLQDRVSVLGYVPESVLEALYRDASAFVYPSLYEGFGLPPLEAMARGVPTLVANAASLPEVVGDGALLFDPHSAEALTRALESVVESPNLREDLARRGKERAAQFRWSTSAFRHLELFSSIVRENRPSCV